MPKISVIIPCYNLEQKMLDRCVKSVLDQEFDDYEIIIVDDGSVSQYRDGLLEVEHIDQRIKLFHQENKGVSAARNTGVREANGEYIVFLDGDDALLPEFFLEAYELCKKYDVDFLIGGNALMHDKLWQERDTNVPISFEKIDSTNKSNLINHLVGNVKRFGKDGGYIGRGPWTRFIQKKVAKEILFDEDLCMGEDIEWNIRMLNACKNVYIAYKIWYLYYFNPNSATKKYNPNMITNVEKGLFKLEKQLDFNDTEQNMGFCVHLINELRKIYVCYIGHKECDLKTNEKREIIAGFYKEEPWIKIKTVKIKSVADYKTALKIVSFDMHIFFFVLNVRNLFHLI